MPQDSSNQPDPSTGNNANTPLQETPRQVIQGEGSTYIEADIVNLLNSVRKVESLSLLPKPNAVFAGRKRDLEVLQEKVSFGQAFYLWGMPGSGKTALLSEFINRNKTLFPGGVLYLDLEPEFYEVNLDKSISEITLSLQVNFPPINDKLAFLIPALSRFRQCLVILDNAHSNPDKLGEITSTLHPEVAYLVVGQQRFEVDKPRQHELKSAILDESRLIFEAYCQHWGVALTSEEAELREKRDLLKYCGGLPLAHKIVASLLSENGGFGNDLLKRLQRELPKLEGANPEESEKQRNLTAAFNLSYRGLKDERLERFYARLSRYPGSFNATEAAQWALTAKPRRILGIPLKENPARWYGPAEPEASPVPDAVKESAKLLEQLVGRALLEEAPLSPSGSDRQPSYTFHNLLRFFALTKLDEQNIAATKSVNLSPEVIKHEYRFLVEQARQAIHAANYQQAIPLYEQAIQLADDPTSQLELMEEQAELFVKVPSPKNDPSLYDPTRLYEQILGRYRGLSNNAGILRALGRLVELYGLQNKVDKALGYAMQKQAMLEETGDLTGELQAVLEQANLLLSQGELEAAEACWRKWQSAHPSNTLPSGGEMLLTRLEEVVFIEHLAEKYYQQGNIPGSIALYRRAFNLRRGQGRGSQISNYLDLADAFLAKGEAGLALEYSGLAVNTLSRQAYLLTPNQGINLFNFAIQLSERGYNRLALFILLQLLPFFQSMNYIKGVAATLHGIGSVYSALGEKHKALEYYEQALPIFRAVGDRSGEAATLHGIGSVYSALGEKHKALEYYEQALPIEKAVGDRSGEAATLHGIGSVYSDLGENHKALEYYEQALPIEKAVGDRRGEASTLSNIGSVYSDLGEPHKALEYYEQALPIQKAVGDRRGEAATLHGIGSVYSALGEKHKALEYYEQALPIRRAVGDRSGEAPTLNNIGSVYSDLGEKHKALEYYEQALPIQKAVGDFFGEINTLRNFASVYEDLDNLENAIANMEKAAEIATAISHPELNEIIIKLDRLKLKKAAETDPEAAKLLEELKNPAEEYSNLAEKGEVGMASSNSHALLVGVGTYHNHPRLDAPVTARDAQALAKVLEDSSRAGYANVKVLTENMATSTYILEALQTLASHTDNESIVFLFFASHGVSAAGTDGEYYFLTHDSQKTNNLWQTDTILTDLQLREAIHNIKARKLLVIFQTCHSGFMTAEPLTETDQLEMVSALSNQVLEEMLGKGEGRYVISACREGQASWFKRADNNTFFIQHILKGLRGEVPELNKRGYIGLFELFEYVSEKLAEDVKININTIPEHKDVKQEPVITVRQGVGAFPVALYRGQGARNLSTEQWKEIEENLNQVPSPSYVKILEVQGDNRDIKQAEKSVYSEGDAAGGNFHKGDQLNDNAMKFGSNNTFQAPVGPKARQINMGQHGQYVEGNSGGVNLSGKSKAENITYTDNRGNNSTMSNTGALNNTLPGALEGLFSGLFALIEALPNNKDIQEAAEHLKKEVGNVCTNPILSPNKYIVAGAITDLKKAGHGILEIVSVILVQPQIKAAFAPYLEA